MKAVKTLFLFIGLLILMSSIGFAEHLLVAEDGGPAKDVVTLTEVGVYLVQQGYDVGPAKLDSEVDREDLDERMTIFIYNNKAAIIDGGQYLGVAADVSDFLHQKGVESKIIKSEDVKSDDLRKTLDAPQPPAPTPPAPTANAVAVDQKEQEQKALTERPQEQESATQQEIAPLSEGEITPLTEEEVLEQVEQNNTKRMLTISLSVILGGLAAILGVILFLARS